MAVNYNFKALYLFIVLSIILVGSCSGANSSLSCRQEERDALIRFAKSLDPTFLNVSKSSKQDCCNWSWITCDGVTGHVVKLRTQVSTYPYGILPAIKLDASLAQLKFLNHLDLRGIVLERCSQIPEFIGSMKNLKFLDLSGVGLCGSVPPHFGNLTNLEFLSLGRIAYGSFSRLSLDESRWISRLVALKHLDLSYVSVDEGAHNDLMTVLSALPSLSYLDLHHCGLIRDDMVLNSTKHYFSRLQYLDLSGNYLRGKIPSAIQNMTSLTYLDLSNNQFNSSVPSWFSRFSNLRHLYLSRNKFDSSLASLPVTLKELDVSLNQLSGIIPSSLGNFSVLEMVNLSSNHLIGDIPRSFGRLKKLDLSNNHLNGAITVEQLSSLEYLDLSQNNISAPIPSDIGRNMTQLRSLFLYDNLITGPIPTSLCDMFLLEEVNIADNMLIGSIPNCKRHIVSRRLDLRNNQLSGTVSENMRQLLPSLEYLDVSNNRISGDIPLDIGRMLPKLRYLILKDNLISGSIPRSFCDMFDLEVLDLGNNTLTKNIPDCWQGGSSLVVINLSSNNLTGVIPSSIMNLSSLWSLHLNKNNLDGELPNALGYVVGLVILDLGENDFSGNVPPWIGESIWSLQILRLRDNKLNGTIPHQLCGLVALQILDLAGNDLEGQIPSCFHFIYGMSDDPYPSPPDSLSPAAMVYVSGAPSADWSKEKMTEVSKGREMEYTKNLQYVITLDLSRNKLIGSVPEELTLLTKLDCLNLSYNGLSGPIPQKIGSLKLLESLDLSNNRLSGTIPPSVSELSMLSHFNLANNNLKGRIPKGNQLDTVYDSDHSIYDGNPLLCGDPLPKLCPGDHNKLHSSSLPYVPSKHNEDDQDLLEMPMFYVVVMLGFGTGFWGVIGALILNKTWRDGYFKFVQEMMDKVYVVVKVKVARFKR